MSDVTTGALFNPQFFMNPPWWLGRVEEKSTWNENIQGETFTSVGKIQGWSHRYKVRVFNWHTGDLATLEPKDMAYCQVMLPVTAGSGHGGASITPSIESGSVVFGFFMDGMAGQEGYIIGVLPNSNNNVPKSRGEPAPNQSKTTASPQGGPPVTTKPAPPALGPGSLSTIPLEQVPNIDQLSISQLTKLLDPSKTPSSSVFRAAAETREKYRADQISKGLTPNKAEEERLALIATVKASRQSGNDAGTGGNCNRGYQQFNDTYTDGNPMTAAKVPDDRIVGSVPLVTTDALHIESLARQVMLKDSKKKISLSDAAKQGNSDISAIQTTMKNLINSVEESKKIYNQISAFSTGVSAFSATVQAATLGAVDQITKFVKSIVNKVRGYILREMQERVRLVQGYLFPSEVPKLYTEIESGMGLLNSLFNKLVGGLQGLIAFSLSKLLDKAISTPISVAESMLSDIMSNVLGPITLTLQLVLQPISGIMGSISGLLNKGSGLLGTLGAAVEIFGTPGFNLFNALEFAPGISQFFAADDPPAFIPYGEISQDRAATPTGDAVAPRVVQTSTPVSPTGKTTSPSDRSSATITSNTNTSILDEQLSTPITQAERDAVARGEILGGGTITSRGNVRDVLDDPADYIPPEEGKGNEDADETYARINFR
jgi:hypothetical protein